eukprot:Skav209219  [mRNA]  locus=scaffold603:65632:73714:+ [translate_table: standard]
MRQRRVRYDTATGDVAGSQHRGLVQRAPRRSDFPSDSCRCHGLRLHEICGRLAWQPTPLAQEDAELRERYRSLKEEHAELVQRLEQERHQVVTRAGVEQEQKETIQTLENEHLQLKETIKELQARRAAFEHTDTMGHGDERMQLRIAELEQLLREHVVQLSTLPAQEAQEEALDLVDHAESLGCQVHFDAAQVRLCRCGSVFPSDGGSFCGKCGSQWSGGVTEPPASQQEIAQRIATLREQIQTAEEARWRGTTGGGQVTGWPPITGGTIGHGAVDGQIGRNSADLVGQDF